MVSENFVWSLIALVIVVIVILILLKFLFGAFVAVPMAYDMDPTFMGILGLDPPEILNS